MDGRRNLKKQHKAIGYFHIVFLVHGNGVCVYIKDIPLLGPLWGQGLVGYVGVWTYTMPEGQTLDARNAFASQNFQQSSNKQGKTRQYRTRCLSRKSLVPQGFAGMKRNEWVPGKTDVIFLVRMRSAVQIRPAAPRKALSPNGFKAFLLQKRKEKAGFWKRIRPLMIEGKLLEIVDGVLRFFCRKLLTILRNQLVVHTAFGHVHVIIIGFCFF